MSFLNKLKDKIAPAKEKAAGLAKEHGDKIDHGLDKVARTVDQRTKGKYSDKIQHGTGKAKEGLHRFADKGDGTQGPGDTPGPGGAPGPGGTQGPGGTGTPPPPPPGAGGPA
ncbi:antitoxin [Streptomyces sp. LHD-70]|uniref:antitoxin n=1 Tax=Streptomyces sp. LHD-70 TaxID=3072140 RepID=UPI0028103C05|nr:antitoxin [Streptomyces sp. LHD-70]MDQ8703471.1 antitoxin [Streptomyces sp. LHD-70]